MIKLQGYFSRFGSRADGSASLSFTTQELQPDDFADMQRASGSYGWILFKENEINYKDIPKEDTDPNKTPSKRLRATLYRLWQQEGSQLEFDVFYREKMELLITNIKNKLD